MIEFVTVLKVDSGLYQAVEHAQRLERSQAMYVMNLGEPAPLPRTLVPFADNYRCQTEPVPGGSILARIFKTLSRVRPS